MSYSLSSVKGVISGNISRSMIGVIKWDTRSVDYGSYRVKRGYIGSQVLKN